MSKSMNEATHENLMKVVERAVRPLRAGTARKLAMREELLGHLTANYEEELARQTDDKAALAAAIDRFGNPAELSRELAGSLTWFDHVAWASERCGAAIEGTFVWQRGESFAPFAFRSGGCVTLLNLLFFLLTVAVVWLDGGDRFDPTFASFNRFTFTLFATMTAGGVALLWAIQSTYAAAYRSGRERRWLMVAIGLAGWTGLVVLVGAAFWLGITLDIGAVFASLPRIALCTAAVLPPCVLLVVWAAAHSTKQNELYERWSRLECE
jgi:hypothetical protein